MQFDLGVHHETSDGSRPTARHFPKELAAKMPLAAMAVVERGDAFEAQRAAPPDGSAHVTAWFSSHVDVELHGEPAETKDRIFNDAVRLLGHAPHLVARLSAARRLVVEVVPQGGSYRQLGYPSSALARAAGLFWDDPGWEFGRIALRAEHLPRIPALVAHELAHFIHCVAFTVDERNAIDALLRPTFGSRANMDEAFAIYSEQEFLLADRFATPAGKPPAPIAVSSQFSAEDRRGPGVYGVTRTQWDDNHVFTRFMRKLYHPHAPLAGLAATHGARKWKNFLWQ